MKFAEEAAQLGKTTHEDIVKHTLAQIVSGDTKFAAEDPDAPENFPRSLFVWRSNLISSSAKGQEYFMKHLLGASDSLLSTPNEEDKPEEMVWREDVEGKLDLLVALTSG